MPLGRAEGALPSADWASRGGEEMDRLPFLGGRPAKRRVPP